MKTKNPLKQNYKFIIPEEKHIPQLTKMFTDVFCDSEPMTQYLNFDKDKFKIFAEAVVKNAVKDGLSVIALDKDIIIACALVEDYAEMGEVPLDFDPKFEYIATLLESLGKDFFIDKKFSRRNIAHLFITAVKKEYRQQGLSVLVNLKAIEIAQDAGFKFMYSELTNFYNELGIFHHFPAKKRLTGSCKYNEYQCQGIKPFENLLGEAHGYLWEIIPNSALKYTSDNIAYEENL